METDGSINPEEAVKNASEILINHFKVISDIVVPELEKEKPAKKKETKTKKKKA